MAPAESNSNQSQLNIFTASPGECLIHCNKYQRLKVDEVNGLIIDSSIARLETFCKYTKPSTKDDVIQMLGDESHKVHTVFRTGDTNPVLTVAVGIFDCLTRTWSLYADNPKYNDPLVVLPLVIKSRK